MSERGDDAKPLLALRGVTKTYPSAEGEIVVLDAIDLDVDAGEMVAIVGQSGSGKSTLMNILGCLDHAGAGEYRIAGRATASLGADALAALRREHFGFIFQRYHLIGHLSAQENVEMPAVYVGADPHARRAHAAALLARLGLAGRAMHRPAALSGGQQQRVSIARALMNGGQVILADEPTGALDSRSGAEVIEALLELHANGHTVIIVTHDAEVAEVAERIVEIHDGRIVADRRVAPEARRFPNGLGALDRPRAPDGQGAPDGQLVSDGQGGAHRYDTVVSQKLSAPSRHRAVRRWRQTTRDSLVSAWTALSRYRMRTALTVLSVMMGIASVVSMVAAGDGARQKVLDDIQSWGADAIYVLPGETETDRRADAIHTLQQPDIAALRELRFVAAVTPVVWHAEQLRLGNRQAKSVVLGVDSSYFLIRNRDFILGSTFTNAHIRRRAAVVILDEVTQRAMFPVGVDPIGKTVLVGKVPSTVIGVVASDDSEGNGRDRLRVYMPVDTVQARMTGAARSFDALMIKLVDGIEYERVAGQLERTLTRLHRLKDFHLLSFDKQLKASKRNAELMALLMLSIASISLTVAGIGVMNVMLVSVSERTAEIGIRMAVGARQADIRRQFITEAVLVCTLGGLFGVVLCMVLAAVFAIAVPLIPLRLSVPVIALACLSATLAGIAFGYVPARNAARLDPIRALNL